MKLQPAWTVTMTMLALVCLIASSVHGQAPPPAMPLSSGPAAFGDVPPQFGPGPQMGPAPGMMSPNILANGMNMQPGRIPLGPGPEPGSMPQGPYAPGPQGPPMGPMGMMPGPNGAVIPAAHMSSIAPMPHGAPMGGGACQACNGAGCDYCSPYGGGGYGAAGGVNGNFDFLKYLRYLLPYSEGGNGQRWYDIHFDLMYLKREDVGRGRTVFMNDGNRGSANAPLALASPNTLDSSDLDFDGEGVPRISIAFQIGAGSNIEATYFGLAHWSTTKAVSDPTSNLFSIYSDYGLTPPVSAGFDNPGGGNLNNGNGTFGDGIGEAPRTNGGLASSDAAAGSVIAYQSEIHSVDFNFRRRWVGTNTKIQGSWLYGVRYFQLHEQFSHRIGVRNTIAQNAPPFDLNQGSTSFTVNTRNALTGFQMGGDLWATIVPGVRVGGELKAGVYGNKATQITNGTFTVVSPNPVGAPPTTNGPTSVNTVNGRVTNPDIAFLGEMGLMGTWRVNYNWTIRLGYQFIYVDGVALAMENFNPTTNIFNPLANRVETINDNGSVFFHGATGGIEYIW